jgi:hypothetical protein
MTNGDDDTRQALPKHVGHVVEPPGYEFSPRC